MAPFLFNVCTLPSGSGAGDFKFSITALFAAVIGSISLDTAFFIKIVISIKKIKHIFRMFEISSPIN